jgi:hypothetical protein
LLIRFSIVSKQIIIAKQHTKKQYNMKGKNKGGWNGLKNEQLSPQAPKELQ